MFSLRSANSPFSGFLVGAAGPRNEADRRRAHREMCLAASSGSLIVGLLGSIFIEEKEPKRQRRRQEDRALKITDSQPLATAKKASRTRRGGASEAGGDREKKSTHRTCNALKATRGAGSARGSARLNADNNRKQRNEIHYTARR